jgi:hypothetical protein
MRTKVIILIAFIIAAWGVGSAVSQQEQAKQDPGSTQLLDRIGAISDAQRQVMQKLDTVLANQQKILSELDIVKVRATRR